MRRKSKRRSRRRKRRRPTTRSRSPLPNQSPLPVCHHRTMMPNRTSWWLSPSVSTLSALISSPPRPPPLLLLLSATWNSPSSCPHPT
ncbi:unnamed protein product, partial [Dibothriocephalus latus]